MINFDIDTDEVQKVADDLGSNTRQVNQAFSRALKRTAGTLRRRGAKELKTGLGLRNAKLLRRRLKEIKLRRKGKSQEIKLWYGTNDFPVSAFKGKPRKTVTGASFRDTDFRGGFIAKNTAGNRTILMRKGKAARPLTEAKLPVADLVSNILEDDIFPDVEDVFFHHFRKDLRARTVFGVGRGKRR